MKGISSGHCGEIYFWVCFFQLCSSFYRTKMITRVFCCQNSVTYRRCSIHISWRQFQNRRCESIIFSWKKETWDEGRTQCVLKVACVFLWLADFSPFPISRGWMFSSPSDRKCTSLEWDLEHSYSFKTAHPPRTPPTTHHSVGTELCFPLLSIDSCKQTK